MVSEERSFRIRINKITCGAESPQRSRLTSRQLTSRPHVSEKVNDHPTNRMITYGQHNESPTVIVVFQNQNMLLNSAPQIHHDARWEVPYIGRNFMGEFFLMKIRTSTHSVMLVKGMTPQTCVYGTGLPYKQCDEYLLIFKK